MAYENLKSAIKQAIKNNNNQEITGDLLQSTLLSIIDNFENSGYAFKGYITADGNTEFNGNPSFYITVVSESSDKFGYPGVYAVFEGFTVLILIYKQSLGLCETRAYIHSNTGKKLSTANEFFVSSFIEVDSINILCKISSKVLSGSDNAGVAFYDENKQFLSCTGKGSKIDVTITDTRIKYFRVCGRYTEDVSVFYYQKSATSNLSVSRTIGDIASVGLNRRIDGNSYCYKSIYNKFRIPTKIRVKTASDDIPVNICLYCEDLNSIVKTKVIYSTNNTIKIDDVTSFFDYDFKASERNIYILFQSADNIYYNINPRSNLAGYITNKRLTNFAGLLLSIEVEELFDPSINDLMPISKLDIRSKYKNYEYNEFSEDDIYAMQYINNGDVNLKAGATYHIKKPIILTTNTRITGNGATLILDNDECIFKVAKTEVTKEHSKNVVISGVKFDGADSPDTSVDYTSLKTNNFENLAKIKSGIVCSIEDANLVINCCEFKNFKGSGIYDENSHGEYRNKIKILGCNFNNCTFGIYLGVRSEYNIISNNTVSYNSVGIFCAGGNNFFSCNHSEFNRIGMVISGRLKNNDSHGSISCCSFNHNRNFGIIVMEISNGYTFNGCHVFEGPIIINNSVGLAFVGCEFSCNIRSENISTVNGILISSSIFYKNGYGTEIENKDKISLKNNRYLDYADNSYINNDIL